MTTTLQDKPAFTGNIQEIVILFLPLVLMTFSTSAVFFVDKLFLARLAAETMEAAVSVANLCRVFQIPCVLVAMMAQVCVGRLQGAGHEAEIGRNIWQFIWFSLLSTLITVPLSLLYGMFYFEGTIIENSVLSYFIFLMLINFLYPLGASLSCFYLGRGKTHLILGMTLAGHSLNLLLAYLFIFGVKGQIPPLGLIGGALGTLIAQGTFCIILLCNFLSAKHAQTYGSHNWRFQPRLFYECVFPGFLRALNSMSGCLCWTFVAHLMIEKQGDYLLIWSFGCLIGLFLPFVGSAICQALTTIASNMVGAGNLQLLQRVKLSGFVVIATIIGLMAIPMLMFSEWTFHFLFPNISLASTSVRVVFLGLWLSFSFGTLAFIPLSCILAFKDTKFLLATGSCCWVSGFFTMYLAVNMFNIPADQCWIVLSFTGLFDLFLFSWRANRLSFQKKLVANLMTSGLPSTP